MNTQYEIPYWERRAQYIYLIQNNSFAGRHLLNSNIEIITRLTKINNKSKILEVGCAAGTQAIEFFDRGFFKVFGIDIDKNIIDRACDNAKRRQLAPQFQVGDAYFLPFRNGSFDMVFSVGVMEHLSDLSISIKEQKRVLKKDGRILISVPNFYCPWWTIGKKIRSWLSYKPHFKMPGIFKTFRPKELVDILKSHDFVNITWKIGDAVIPQCPDFLFPINVMVEKIIKNIPLIRNTQAMLYVVGRKV